MKPDLQKVFEVMWEIEDCRHWSRHEPLVWYPIQTELDWAEYLHELLGLPA